MVHLMLPYLLLRGSNKILTNKFSRQKTLVSATATKEFKKVHPQQENFSLKLPQISNLNFAYLYMLDGMGSEINIVFMNVGKIIPIDYKGLIPFELNLCGFSWKH